MHTPESLLKTYWGYPAFLPHQREIIASIIEGNDTLAVMATGSGKSLCYQLPALYLGGLTVVISPLISLMKDQVDDLAARGIPAVAYNSSLDYRDRVAVEAGLQEGTYRLVFVSPERCVQPGFLALLQQAEISLIAIDEAHCISAWGHDFRPEYRQLGSLRKAFPGVPVIALTATAIPQVRKDIREQLCLSSPREFTGSFDRKNLHYAVIPKVNALLTVLDYCSRHRDWPGIIYCFSKQESGDLAEQLRKRGFKALAYHAGLSRQERATVQEAFIRGTIKIVCATVAFGMGINKPDIRYIIHYTMPMSIESYYQETGRAGRDGRDAECLLLYSRADVNRVRALLTGNGSNDSHAPLALRKLQEMSGYCESTACRRSELLAYFGEEYLEETCMSCDNCDRPHELIDGTLIARAIIGCVSQLPSPSGIDSLSDLLAGSAGAKIRSPRRDTLPSSRPGRGHSKPQYRAWINDLVRQGFLAWGGDRYPVICTTKKGLDLLTGHMRVMLPAPATLDRCPAAECMTPDEELFLHLKEVRRSLAAAAKVPPYVIFPDKSLREMARVKPSDARSFGRIPGVGNVRREKYGPVFIPAIRAFTGPSRKSSARPAICAGGQ